MLFSRHNISSPISHSFKQTPNMFWNAIQQILFALFQTQIFLFHRHLLYLFVLGCCLILLLTKHFVFRDRCVLQMCFLLKPYIVLQQVLFCFQKFGKHVPTETTLLPFCGVVAGSLHRQCVLFLVSRLLHVVC